MALGVLPTIGECVSRVQSEIPASVKQFVDSTISGSKVAGFSKSYCPFCHKAYDAITSFKVGGPI